MATYHRGEIINWNSPALSFGIHHPQPQELWDATRHPTQNPPKNPTQSSPGDGRELLNTLLYAPVQTSIEGTNQD